MKDIVLIGMQGSGKGTQGELLHAKYDYRAFDTGRVLRGMASADTDQGRQLKQIIDSGTLIPDDVISSVLNEFLDKIPHGSGVLYDGFPRDEMQYKIFHDIMEQRDRDFMVVYIQISEEAALERLRHRRMCPLCKKVYHPAEKHQICKHCHTPLVQREDDKNTASVLKRITTYKQKTEPLLESFKMAGKLITVDGQQDVSEVFEAMDSILQSKEVII